MAFQKANALDADGVVGRLTWEVLNSGSAVANTNATPTLMQGNTGEYVKKLQTYLINIGYSCGNSGADGTFGTGTYNAVVAFQKKNGLNADGIVGGNTWKALTSPDAIENDHRSDVLKFGSRGDAVKELQELLIQLEYSCGADGIFGTGTHNAVRIFQQINGLGVDGIAGPNTLALLKSGSAKPYDGSIQPSYPGTIHGDSESCRAAIIEEARYWIWKAPILHQWHDYNYGFG